MKTVVELRTQLERGGVVKVAYRWRPGLPLRMEQVSSKEDAVKLIVALFQEGYRQARIATPADIAEYTGVVS